MGIPASEKVTTPYWTSFPAFPGMGVDWDDHGEAHKAVMRMFPEELPGPIGERRAVNGILFRHDLLSGAPTILVQSAIPPERVPERGRAMSLPSSAWAFQEGMVVEFRVAANPVRRFRGVTRVVNDDELPIWLDERLNIALADIAIINTTTRVTRATRGQRILTVKTIDAAARVANSEQFADLRRHGVGRSKSYGAGLLTARAVG